jgi:hypothetical protein
MIHPITVVVYTTKENCDTTQFVIVPDNWNIDIPGINHSPAKCLSDFTDLKDEVTHIFSTLDNGKDLLESSWSTTKTNEYYLRKYFNDDKYLHKLLVTLFIDSSEM